jgi:hypothetical protein
MSSALLPSDRNPVAGLPVAVVPPIGWRRLVLLLALLNSPLFFNGCESQHVKFTVGAAIPFAEFDSKLLWFSWPLLMANGLATFAAIWLATRYVPWLNRMAASRWFLGTLIAVALLFNSWLVWMPFWVHTVFSPQATIAGLMVRAVEGPEGASETAVRWAWTVSGRIYYVLCVAVISGGAVGLRAFLRRYFFVRTGSRWQIQLGGLVIAMLILGTGIGMAIRLLMQQ